MVLELYLDLESQPCRAVYIFAKKNNIPFEFKHVELMQGQQRAEEYLKKVNPIGTVPAMRDGDFALAESIAILLYLVRKFKTPEHWYPSDLHKRARVDEYLSWQHTTVRSAGCKVYIIKAMVPVFLDQPLPPEMVERAMKEMEESLRLFEEKFLQDHPFIAGEEISLADLMAIAELMQPVPYGYDLFRSRPKMAAWRSRVEAAIGKELFQEAHKILDPKNMNADILSPALKELAKQTIYKYLG